MEREAFWHQIHTFRNLVEFMPWSVSAVLAARGGPKQCFPLVAHLKKNPNKQQQQKNMPWSILDLSCGTEQGKQAEKRLMNTKGCWENYRHPHYTRVQCRFDGLPAGGSRALWNKRKGLVVMWLQCAWGWWSFTFVYSFSKRAGCLFLNCC